MREQGDPWGCGRRVLAALLALVAAMGDAHAGELRKCVLRDGRHAYVSEACPAGSRELWQQDVAPDPRADAERKRRLDEIGQWQKASRQEASARQRGGSRASTSSRGAAASASTCERARQRRDRIRDREWMRMTYDRMIQLDQDVSDACR